MVEPINYAAALRRSWRLLVVLALLFALIAVVLPVGHRTVDKDNPVRWETTAIVGAPPGSGIVGSNVVTTSQILFYGNSFDVRGAAFEAAKTPGPALKVISAMSASSQTTKSGSGSSTASTSPVVKVKNATGLVVLSASAATKDESAALTNAYAAALGAKLSAIAAASTTTRTTIPDKTQKTTATPASSTGYLVLIPAYASTAKSTTAASSNLSSSHKVRGLVGLVLGLLVGALIVLVIELTNRRLRSAPRAEAHFSFPVLAEIPQPWPPPGDGVRPGVVIVSEPTSRAAESYRKLRMSVMFESMAPTGARVGGRQDAYVDDLLPVQFEPYVAPDPASRSVILVVSPGKEETRPQVVANLAAAYGEAGQRVIIATTADLDSGRAGESDGSFAGPISPDDVRSHLQPSSVDNLSMLSLRPFVKNSAQLVVRAAAIFDAARQIADVVLIEAPPFLELHHGEALAHAVDVVLVVGEYGATTFDEADRTGALLRRIGAPVLGVVFTEARVDKAERTNGAPPARQATPVDVVQPDLLESPGQPDVGTQDQLPIQE